MAHILGVSISRVSELDSRGSYIRLFVVISDLSLMSVSLFVALTAQGCQTAYLSTYFWFLDRSLYHIWYLDR